MAMAPLIAVIATACGSSGGSSSSGGTDSASQREVSLTVALSWTGSTPVCCIYEEAAQDYGYYKKLNLNVTFHKFAGSALPVQDLIAGRAQIGEGNLTATFAPIAEGQADFRFLGQSLINIPGLSGKGNIYAGKSSIKRAQDLKGQKIGLTSGANPTDPGYNSFLGILQNVGLGPSDVTWEVIGNQPQRAAALVAGRIDITTIGVEAVSQVQQTSGLQIIDLPLPESAKLWSGCVCLYSTASALKDPDTAEAVRRYVLAIMQVARKLAADQSFFMEVATHFVPALKTMSPEAWAFAWDYERASMGVNGGFNLKEINTYVKSVYEVSVNPKFAGKVDMSSHSDSQFVKQALDVLGGPVKVNDRLTDPPQFAVTG
jgi:ABC-type nitrate/sulfonate/bicarbonate transport system substrate-binding protein